MRGSRWAWEPPGRAQRAQLRQQLQHLMQVPISSLTVHHSSNTTTSDLLDSEATAAAPPESLATAQASLRSLQLQMGWWSMDKGAEALCERESVLGQCQQPEAGLQQVLEEELDQDASSRGSRKTNEKRGAQGLLCSAPASLLAQPTCSKSDPEEEGQAPARAPSLRLRQSSPHSCGLAKQPASVGTLVDAKAGAQAEALQQQQVQMQVQAWVAPVTQVPAEQVAAQVQVGKAEGEGEAVQQPGACRGAEDATAGFRYSLEDSARERLIHFMQLPAPRHAAALPKHKLRFFSASNALEAIPEAHAAVGQPGSDAEGRAQLNRGWSAVRPVPLPQQQQRRRPNRSLARRASAPTDATLHRMMQWFQSVGTPSKQPEAFHDVFHFLGNADEGEGGGDGAEKAPAGEPGGLKASAHPSGGTPASGHCPQQQQQQVWEAQEAQPNSLGANDLAPLSISSSRREHHGACSVVAVGRPRILGPSAPGCILKSRRFCSQCTNVAHGSVRRACALFELPMLGMHSPACSPPLPQPCFAQAMPLCAMAVASCRLVACRSARRAGSACRGPSKRRQQLSVSEHQRQSRWDACTGTCKETRFKTYWSRARHLVFSSRQSLLLTITMHHSATSFAVNCWGPSCKLHGMQTQANCACLVCLS